MKTRRIEGKEKKNVLRVTKQMVKSRQDVVGGSCVKDSSGKIEINIGGSEKVF